MSKDSSAKYYRSIKERLQKKFMKCIEAAPKKKKKWQYWHERSKNLSEDVKKLVEYRKKYKI